MYVRMYRCARAGWMMAVMTAVVTTSSSSARRRETPSSSGVAGVGELICLQPLDDRVLGVSPVAFLLPPPLPSFPRPSFFLLLIETALGKIHQDWRRVLSDCPKQNTRLHREAMTPRAYWWQLCSICAIWAAFGAMGGRRSRSAARPRRRHGRPRFLSPS